MSSAVATVLRCSTQQERLTEVRLDEIRALRDSIVDMEMRLYLISSNGDLYLALIEDQTRKLTATEKRVIELSHTHQGFGVKVDAATQKLDQAREDQEIALVALRIGLESHLQRLNHSRAKDNNAEQASSLGPAWAEVLLLCMTASITAAVVVKRSSMAPLQGLVGAAYGPPVTIVHRALIDTEALDYFGLPWKHAVRSSLYIPRSDS
jgi:hypothetical protein